MPTILTVCETCKREDWDPESTEQTHGEQLADLVNHALMDSAELTFRTHACLMGCSFACNITLQSPGKIGYVLGMFEPNTEAAEAIVDFAHKYAASETGQVPYKTWPQGVKGHFRARMIPAE